MMVLGSNLGSDEHATCLYFGKENFCFKKSNYSKEEKNVKQFWEGHNPKAKILHFWRTAFRTTTLSWLYWDEKEEKNFLEEK